MGDGLEVRRCRGVGRGARHGAEVEVRWSRGIDTGAHRGVDKQLL